MILRAVRFGLMLFALQAAAAPQTGALRDRLDAAVGDLPGMAVFMVGGAGVAPVGAAVGSADPDGRPFTVDTPLRIASITKTYVAATVLRLHEQGRIQNLDASVRASVAADFSRRLQRQGHDTDAMTLRHLLMHVAGLADHADDAYVQRVLADPAHVWTRAGQLALLDGRPPLGRPGEVFGYSDTGYVLLGHVLERSTGEDLATAVRRALRFGDIGLNATWWEILEAPPAGVPARAHQYLDGTDVTNVHASADLFGGGGLVAPVREVAMFVAALFRGAVFDDADTLAWMREAPGHPQPQAYRVGLQPRTVAGFESLGHLGFWGSIVLYVPALDLAIAGAVLDSSGFPALLRVIDETVADYAAVSRGACARTGRARLGRRATAKQRREVEPPPRATGQR